MYEKGLGMLLNEVQKLETQLTQIHLDLNGKSEQLLNATQELARRQGADEEKARANKTVTDKAIEGKSDRG